MGILRRWRLRRAYRLVLNDLSELRLLTGVYDAKNGSDTFMYGVQTVMETIAFEAQDFDFEDMFIQNMAESKKKAGITDE